MEMPWIKERLTEQVKVHITEFQPQLDMVETKCYAKPKYVEDSKEVPGSL